MRLPDPYSNIRAMADHQLNQIEIPAFACTFQAPIPIIRATTDHQLSQIKMPTFTCTP